MSIYRCAHCENIIDADEQGCNEHPFSDTGCICDSCSEEFACFSCGETKKDNQYCKITDQYYCGSCV